MPVADHMTGFCRDCLNEVGPRPPRCPSCGSPRLVRHRELYDLTLAHIDCDAFYASVEKRDNPDLADKPVIVGGGKRGVVSTCCYIARIHGVRSAMPMFKALEACPDAVVIKPDMEKYVRVGRQIRQMMLELTPLVEPISIDEAFLELKGTELIHHHEPPARLLARFAQRVEREIGVTVSVGLSYCKFLAKIASDIKKPRGYSVIGAEEAKSFLAPQPVTLIWGVGRAFAEKLAQDGIRTIGQLQEMDEVTLMRAYGSRGQHLFNLARGIDHRVVHTDGEAKSVSAETTFFDDISSFDVLSGHLRSLSEKVARRLKKNELAGQTVVLKLKTHDFKTRTRNFSLDSPTQLADRIFRTGLSLLEKETGATRFRLIGIGVTGLSSPELADPLDLVDQQAGRRAKAEAAIDKLRDKFGLKSVQTGYTFHSAPLPERISTRGEDADSDSNS